MGGRRLIARLAAAALAALALAGAAAAPPASAPSSTITWLVLDAPPHFSYPPRRPPQTPEQLDRHGELDGLMRLLIEQMPPETRHRFVEAGLARFEAMARQGEPLCSIFHVRTAERQRWLYFTELMPPLESRDLHVIVRAESLQRFSERGQALQLADLLRRPELVGLVPRDRAYGPRIDGLLRAAGEAAPKGVALGANVHLLPMLRAGRMDYTLEYPSVLAEYLRRNPDGPALEALPLVEGKSTQVATLGCTRNAAGLVAIRSIDAAVRRLAASPQREALIREWRGPLGESDRQRIDAFMNERAKSGPRID